MNSPKSIGRLAGLSYLLIVIFGVSAYLIIPSQLIVWDDPATTVTNITNSSVLFGLGILSEVLMLLAFIALPLFLYKQFEAINKEIALIMVILVLVSIPINFANMISLVDVLSLIRDPQLLGSQSESSIMMLLTSYQNGIDIAQIFWGLWLLPFGYLGLKSKYFPTILGVLLILGCFSTLGEVLAKVIWAIDELPGYLTWPASVGELGSVLFLLVWGALTPQEEAQHNDI